MPEAAVAERTLPQNLEAERSVLGAILLHNDAFNAAAEVIDANDFFRDAHRRIFDKMVKLAERGDAIDLVTLKEELGRSGELVFLVGGNGSGKTTLAKLLVGLYRPESGEIRLDGKPIDSTGESYRRLFTVVFADVYLFESLSNQWVSTGGGRLGFAAKLA